MVGGADILADLGLLRWSESPSMPCLHTATGICIKSYARNKYALISLASRACEPGQNQTFKFVCLLGKWAASLWLEHLPSRWERPGWVHSQVLGGEERRVLLTLMGSWCFSSKHPSGAGCLSTASHCPASSFTLRYRLKAAPEANPHNKIWQWSSAVFQVYLHPNHRQKSSIISYQQGEEVYT